MFYKYIIIQQEGEEIDSEEERRLEEEEKKQERLIEAVTQYVRITHSSTLIKYCHIRSPKCHCFMLTSYLWRMI